MMFGTFDLRQLAVAIGVGALLGAFPDFLGGAGIQAILRGALANELQYVASAVVCDDVAALVSPEGHLLSIGVGGLVGKVDGASLSPKFDSVWLRSVVPEVYENMGGRYANQFLWDLVDQALREGRNQLLRSITFSVINEVLASLTSYEKLREFLSEALP